MYRLSFNVNGIPSILEKEVHFTVKCKFCVSETGRGMSVKSVGFHGKSYQQM